MLYVSPFRPRHCDRNVVPYHPTILLLWGAHMNLQRITNNAWSFYLLKYSLKVSDNHNLCNSKFPTYCMQIPYNLHFMLD